MTMALGHATSGVRSLTREEAEARARAARRSTATTSRSTCAACSRARSSSPPRRSPSRCRRARRDHVRRLRGRGPARHAQRPASSTSARSRDGPLPLTDLAAENVLVVAAAQPDTGSGAGILRTVDPSDKLVYVWTSFEPDDARRVWACFDQPDLKAPHRFTVIAPETWTVTSNSAPDVGRGPGRRRPAAGPSRTRRRSRRTSSWSTPARSTRCASSAAATTSASTAGSRSSSTSSATPPSSSTSPRPGLAFFGERFGQPFPQERYDQVFVPNMGGAMENWGCVTWTDSVPVPQPARPTASAQSVAAVLLHEMAHMWFGDLVTMQWWDDLWLNEAFASWASTWAAVNATEYTDAWATFLAGLKLAGYQVDMGPATHPIRGDVPDVDAGDGQLRRDHLRQGPERAQAAGRLRRRGRVRRGAARLLPRPRVGQHPARRPDVRGRRRRRAAT